MPPSTSSASVASEGARTHSSTLFERASRVRISGSTLVGTNSVSVTYVSSSDGIDKYLDQLYGRVSANAILNSGGRADPVRCYPGTREEVLLRIDTWIKKGCFTERRVFWLSGPAGAGKSAIMQTVAEGCIQDGVLMVNFFFFRGDTSRNHSRSIVATLLSQLFKLYPQLKGLVTDIISADPVVLNLSLHDQFVTLISNPVRKIHEDSAIKSPLLILIDGLDECDSKADQTSLLEILHSLVSHAGSPFIALVSSRTESHLTMAFNDFGTHRHSIFLDKTYRPEDDIRHFLRTELTHIRKTHALGRSLKTGWPSDQDINTIVHKSSGQFIYAATVVRFVAHSSASPDTSMRTVLRIGPARHCMPFAEIDGIYRHILKQANDWSAVRDVLAIRHILADCTDELTDRPILTQCLSILGYRMDSLPSIFADLTAIIKIRAGNHERGLLLDFYHASLVDFVFDRTRSDGLYVDLDLVASKIVSRVFDSEMTATDLFLGFHVLEYVLEPSLSVSRALQRKIPPFPTYKINVAKVLHKIDSLYRDTDPETHDAIIQYWVRWFGVKRRDYGVAMQRRKGPLGKLAFWK